MQSYTFRKNKIVRLTPSNDLCPQNIEHTHKLLFFQDCKYVILILRKGLDRVQKWIPYFYNAFNSTFINQRYNLKSQKPTFHIQEYRQLKELVFATPSRIEPFIKSKAVLLPQLSGLQIKELSQKDLQYIFQRHLSWIKGYILFVVSAYQQSITVLYRFRKNGIALKSELSEVKKYVQLISFDQMTQKSAKNTIIMLQPFLNKEEDMGKFVIGKILAITNRVEYFKVCFEEKMRHLEFQFIYPNLYENIELTMKTSTYRKKNPTQRKIIVYFQEDDNEEEKISYPTKDNNTVCLQKDDENLQETKEEMQSAKMPTKHKIQQKLQNKDGQSTKCQNQSKSIPTTFNVFSIQVNPLQSAKPVASITKAKRRRIK